MRALAGRIIAVSNDGALGASDPDGTHLTALSRWRAFGPGENPSVIASPDSHYLATAAGTVMAVDPREVAVVDHPLSGPLGSNSAIVDFTDGDRGVVVMTSDGGPAAAAQVWVVDLAHHHVTGLGSANEVAGDPSALGAFVTPVTALMPTEGPSPEPNTQVELRDTGRPRIVLATAAELNDDVGQPPGELLNLTVFPDRQGDKVAVLLNPINGGRTNSAMVVLGRSGNLLDVVDAAVGPIEYTTPSWSPDDRSIAYTSMTEKGPAVIALQARAGSRPRIAGAVPSEAGPCIWSPDGHWIACSSQQGSMFRWLIVRASNMATYLMTGPGQALAWLPA
ncbi:MAG: PD40 domain-containing protein [Acidimicrobiales bacterium]|nr:PD40 domain-containing protein [Acidimicrobiales bacterium]